MVGTMLPMAVLMNYFLFGERYFSDWAIFLPATLASFGVLCFAYLLYGLVAISLRNRLPGEKDLYVRLTICITVFVLMTGVYVSLVTRAYDLLHLFGYTYEEKGFSLTFLSLVFVNIFLVFLNEGVSHFENYKANLLVNAQLKKEYTQSQLLGLKSQMNPHFLFNSLNTLSSLIQEDAEQAEEFLDHMSKVYRYLLRNNEEQLVSLQTEIGFIRSYYYLVKARFADALQLYIELPPDRLDDQLPPLTLQMVFDQIIQANSVSRQDPIDIRIRTAGDELLIENTVHPKLVAGEVVEDGIANIRNKFRLLSRREVNISETATRRQMRLPLLRPREAVPA